MSFAALAAVVTVAACGDDEEATTTTTRTTTAGPASGSQASNGASSAASTGAGASGGGGGAGGAECTMFAALCEEGVTTCCDAAGETGACVGFGMGGAPSQEFHCTIPCPPNEDDCPMGYGCNNQDFCRVEPPN
jgi:hypothetical protein